MLCIWGRVYTYMYMCIRAVYVYCVYVTNMLYCIYAICCVPELGQGGLIDRLLQLGEGLVV